MHQKTNQVHIGDHFCLSLAMQGHLKQQVPNIILPKCDVTTGGTVSVYLVHVYTEQKKKNTPCHSPTLTLKGFVFMPLTQIQTFDLLYNNLIATNS